MSRFHGTLFHAYGLAVEQLPLPPRHAFNASDRLLARLNAYFELLMRVCFLVGAKQFADCLAAATDPTMSSPQRLIKNCHVVYRNFTEADWIRTPPLLKASSTRLSQPPRTGLGSPATRGEIRDYEGNPLKFLLHCAQHYAHSVSQGRWPRWGF